MVTLVALILTGIYAAIALMLIKPLNDAFGHNLAMQIDRVAIVLTLAICWPVTIAVCGLATLFMVMFDD
jgi:hypothetical protein